MTPAQLIAYYQNLLIIQYKTKPNASATVGLLSSQVIADLIYTQVQNGFDLTTAIGAQLDILGAYVGARRAIAGFEPTTTYFALPSYSDSDAGFGGFADYSDVSAPSDFWKLYSTVDTAYILSDGQLSGLIAFLIAIHFSDYSNQSLDLICLAFFGSNVTLTDNNNMTITYTHQSTDPSILFALVDFLGLLPHAAGVEVIVVTV